MNVLPVVNIMLQIVKLIADGLPLLLEILLYLINRRFEFRNRQILAMGFLTLLQAPFKLCQRHHTVLPMIRRFYTARFFQHFLLPTGRCGIPWIDFL